MGTETFDGRRPASGLADLRNGRVRDHCDVQVSASHTSQTSLQDSTPQSTETYSQRSRGHLQGRRQPFQNTDSRGTDSIRSRTLYGILLLARVKQLPALRSQRI